MADNKLSGNELKNLLKYTDLKVIKYGANLVKSFEEISVLVSTSQASLNISCLGTINLNHEFGLQ